jgi:hypothetical protein
LLFELIHLRMSLSAVKTIFSLGALCFLLAGSACSAVTVGTETTDRVLNRVSNPNFHSGVFTPEKWDLNRPAGNQAYWLFDKAQPGANGVLMIGSGADWAGLTSRNVSVKPGATVTIAAWVRTSGANPAIDCVFVRFFGAKGFVGQQGAAIPAAEAQWTLASAAVRVPDGALTADASIQLRSKGMVWIGAVGLFDGDQTGRIPSLLSQPELNDPEIVTQPQGMGPDANNNGLSDRLEQLLSVPSEAKSVRRTRRNTTCLQTPTGYITDNDLKVDTILVVNETKEAIQSWQAMGYRTPFMAGFRDGSEYLKAHPGSPQTDSLGKPLDCGLGSYYMVPTADRRTVMSDLFRRAHANGAEGAAPEEPEFFGTGVYSSSFKAEFQAAYGRPWVDPTSSPQARADCQRLMGKLEIELLRACYDGAKAGNPKAEKWMLVHSPVNYFAWAVAFPFQEAIHELKPDHMIAQVWTGTAQSAVSHQGIRKSRTFENAYLEYSSALNLVRGTATKPWLLMDPLEDASGRPMNEYFDNYRRTLAAALLFPETDRYEVMPWPTRIFGQVPDAFATVITTVVNALADMQNQTTVRHDRGTEGIGVFLADSVMWQRNPPFEADFDHFYGLSLPLVMKGIPVQSAYFDRIAEPGYLDPYKVLLVSFDYLKPQRKEDVDALATWVRTGGHLIVCGGDDAYNKLDMWWQREGYPSPHAYLLKALGLDPSGMKISDQAAPVAPYVVAVVSPYKGRNLENRGNVKLDLTPTIARTGAAYIRFTDTQPSDGWGAWIGGLRITGTRDGKPVNRRILPGSPEEGAMTVVDTGSGLAGAARFVDGNRELVYRLQFDPGTRATLQVDIGNQYRIETAPASAAESCQAARVPGSALAAAIDPRAMNSALRVISYPHLGARSALRTPAGDLISEAPVGKGSVIVCGLPSTWFTRSVEADGVIRSLVNYACTQAGLAYKEQTHIGIERGSYVVIKAFDQPAHLSEPAIDLMSADLAIRPAGPIAPDEVVVLKKLPRQTGAAPTLAASSDCVEWSACSGSELRLIASNAAGIQGVIRVMTGGHPIVATAWDAFGVTKSVKVEMQGDTALLRFDSEPMGLGLKVTVKN